MEVFYFIMFSLELISRLVVTWYFNYCTSFYVNVTVLHKIYASLLQLGNAISFIPFWLHIILIKLSYFALNVSYFYFQLFKLFLTKVFYFHNIYVWTHFKTGCHSIFQFHPFLCQRNSYAQDLRIPPIKECHISYLVYWLYFWSEIP